MSKLVSIAVAIVLVVPPDALADSATQTDWTGGADVLGPVSSWDDLFYLASNADWSSSPGAVQHTLSSAHVVDDYFWGAVSVHADDIDGDGDMDVLCAGGSTVAWWANEDGSGQQWAFHVVDASCGYAQHVSSADVDGDGDCDVIAASHETIYWWANVDGTGTGWLEHSIASDFSGNTCAHPVDIDGDGDQDVLGSGYGGLSTRMYWWENSDGSGTGWVEHLIGDSGIALVALNPGDVDGDGDSDFAQGWVSLHPAGSGWFENIDGGSSWDYHEIYESVWTTMPVCPADVDGDGDIDILGGGYKTSWQENVEGYGIQWVEHQIDDVYVPGCIVSVDMDDDGDMDCVCCGEDEEDIVWWENVDGYGQSWTRHDIVDGLLDPTSICPQDFDGDGDWDILGNEHSGNSIAWWEYSEQGTLTSSILYLGNDPGWGSIDWSSDEPSGSSVSFLVRASDDYGNMGNWSDTLDAPCSLAGILAENDSFFQYMAILGTTDPTATTALHDITISWDPVGIEELPIFETALIGALVNPSSGGVAIGFAVAELSTVEFSVYDVSGRLTEEITGQFPEGENTISVLDLQPGVYFVRMASGNFAATQRFVVID